MLLRTRKKKRRDLRSLDNAEPWLHLPAPSSPPGPAPTYAGLTIDPEEGDTNPALLIAHSHAWTGDAIRYTDSFGTVLFSVDGSAQVRAFAFLAGGHGSVGNLLLYDDNDVLRVQLAADSGLQISDGGQTPVARIDTNGASFGVPGTTAPVLTLYGSLAVYSDSGCAASIDTAGKLLLHGGVQLGDYSQIASPAEGCLAWDFANHVPRWFNGSTWS